MKNRTFRILVIITIFILTTLACNLAKLGSTPTEAPAATKVESDSDSKEATATPIGYIDFGPSVTADMSNLATDTAVPPTETSVPAPDITFEGISFDYDPSLATSITTRVDPTSDNGADEPGWMKIPELTNFIFEGYPAPVDRYPTPILYVFSVDEYAQLYPESTTEVNNLKSLLADRPSKPESPLPYNLVSGAAQVIAARLGYIDFKNGSGIVYLTQYAQDVTTINNQSLFYTFQGITYDGKWYVSAAFPVSNSQLPADSQIDDYDAFVAAYPTYLQEMKTFLDAEPAENFTPNLNLLDDVFHSLQVNP